MKYDVNKICDLVNSRLGDFKFRYSRGEDFQTLSINELPSAIFPDSSGGAVAGGSASWIASKHARGNVHEPGMIAAMLAIKAEIEKVDVVLDIGALYGYFSLLSWSIYGGSKIYAFESNRKSFNALNKNIVANPSASNNIFSKLCAVSDRSKEGALVHTKKFKVEEHEACDVSAQDEKQFEELDVVSVDSFCLDNNLCPDIVKIDVEGYQAKIIPGGMQSFLRCRPFILMEFDSSESVNAFGVSNADVVKPLLDIGYNIIWGKHRHRGAKFKVLRESDFCQDQEGNSLAILVP